MKYAFIEIETTGLEIETSEIVEIACIVIENEKIIKQYHSFIKPAKPIKDEIVQIIDLNNEFLKSAPAEKVVLKSLLRVIKNCILVSHNIVFDIDYLKFHCDKYGYKIKNKTIDTLSLARRKLEGKVENFKLSTLAEYFNISNNRNDCFASCILTYQLFQKLQ